MKIVIDTDVFVGAFLSPNGLPARIFGLVEREAFELLLSENILKEYTMALGDEHVKNAHKLTDAQIARTMSDLKASATVVTPPPATGSVATGEDGDEFIECALTGGAEFIVSGDTNRQEAKHHQGIEVLSPMFFLALLVQLL
jgi:putative PIN family toxin of toxin-antitoxin system